MGHAYTQPSTHQFTLLNLHIASYRLCVCVCAWDEHIHFHFMRSTVLGVLLHWDACVFFWCFDHCRCFCTVQSVEAKIARCLFTVHRTPIAQRHAWRKIAIPHGEDWFPLLLFSYLSLVIYAIDSPFILFRYSIFRSIKWHSTVNRMHVCTCASACN